MTKMEVFPGRRRVGRGGRLVRCVAFAWFALVTGVLGRANAEPRDGLWERGLRYYEAEDRRSTPCKSGVVFVGSSSIRLWATRDFFPGLFVINRGLSGSHLADATHYVDRTVFPYEPKVIVVYAGDNDISAGVSPERVLSDYQAFVQVVHEKLSATRIVFLSIKPSPIRRALWSKMREANRLVEFFSTSDERLRYVDVSTPMLDSEGNPRRELFLEDGLHLNVLGYRLWTGIVTPVVTQALLEL